MKYSPFKIPRWAILLPGILALCSCTEDEPSEPGFSRVSGFVINEDDQKLLATDNGLFLFNEESGAYTRIKSETTSESLNHLALSRISDTESLWLASDQGVYNMQEEAFYDSENSPLSTDRISFLHFGGRLPARYFVSAAGLDIYNLSEEWHHTNGRDELFLRHAISGVATASNGYTYVSTNGGVERFKLDVDGISGATLFDTDWSQLPSNEVLTVFVDDTVQAYGTIKGVSLHYSELTKWDWLTLSSRHGLINDTVLSISRDIQKRWWFGTMRGVSSYDEDAGTWENYSSEVDGLPDLPVKFLLPDSSGRIWLATDNGLAEIRGSLVYSYPE